MKWITREHVRVDRVACLWLTKKFVDPDAEFYFVPPQQVLFEAERLGAVPFDVSGVEFGHHGKECSFEAILEKYNLATDPAVALSGKIVNGADTETHYGSNRGPLDQRRSLPASGTWDFETITKLWRQNGSSTMPCVRIDVR